MTHPGILCFLNEEQRKLAEELERRTEEARVDGRLRFKAVSDVDIYVEAAHPDAEDAAEA